MWTYTPSPDAGVVDPIHTAEEIKSTPTYFPIVLAILFEAYNPRVLFVKFLPVIRIRILKFLGLGINQVTGSWLLGWNGAENRFYDILGKEVDNLFFRLYNHTLEQKDVFQFLRRRFHYAFITGTITTIQIILTWKSHVFAAFILSIAIAPVTLIDRQWSTSVTKPPGLPAL